MMGPWEARGENICCLGCCCSEIDALGFRSSYMTLEHGEHLVMRWHGMT